MTNSKYKNKSLHGKLIPTQREPLPEVPPQELEALSLWFAAELDRLEERFHGWTTHRSQMAEIRSRR